jgi:ATP-dependent DNA helicase DinG
VNKTDLASIFGETGVLAKKIANYRLRPQQLSMAESVDTAIANAQTLVVEAATGTGKTYAYLVPALLSAKKVLIATATKTLQDQLVHQDIPQILATLGIARTIQNLKGRDNYLCRYHIQRIVEQEEHQSDLYPLVADIHAELPSLVLGEKSELSLPIAQDAPIWQSVTAHNDHCLASKCPVLQDCFLFKARQKAMSADCVVVNHHLFFADSRLKDDGFAALLPAFEVFIFDEAHQLPDIALQFHSQAFSSAQILRLLRELDEHAVLLQSVHQPIRQAIFAIERLLEGTLDGLKLEGAVDLRRLAQDKLLELETWSDKLHELNQALAQVVLDDDVLLARIKERLTLLCQTMKTCLNREAAGVSCLQPLSQHLKVQWSPFDVADELSQLFVGLKASLIFTSATLQTGHDFTWFLQRMGLNHPQQMVWDSPYAWHEQAMLYIPRGLPDVYHPDFYPIFMQKVLNVILALGGKTFILFTSYKALNWMAEHLPRQCPFDVLVQGQADKRKLLDTFREQANVVLLGTGSFWEGVDVKGEALSCVAIDKLPFANVNEPLLAGRMDYLKRTGESPFDDYLLPQTIISLKQGVGRLLRTETDKGVLLIGDTRLLGRQYAGLIKASLPQMPWTRSEETILEFIATF